MRVYTVKYVEPYNNCYHYQTTSTHTHTGARLMGRQTVLHMIILCTYVMMVQVGTYCVLVHLQRNIYIYINMSIMCILWTCVYVCVCGCTPVNERDSSVCTTRTGNRPRVSGRKGVVVGRGEREEGMTNPHVAAVKVRWAWTIKKLK